MYSRSANYKPANMEVQKIMPSQTINLSKPLKIEVSKIVPFMQGCRYRGPFTLKYPRMVCTSEAVLSDLNPDKQVVLLFDGKTKEGFTKIVSAYSSKELAFLLSKLPRELSEPFTSSLKGTMLEIPQLSADELAHYQQKADKEKILDIEFKKLQQPLKNAKKVDFKKEQSIMV